MANAIVRLPVGYFPDPDKGSPLWNAKIYVGVVDLDPKIPVNQLTVTGRQESGAEVTLPQPIRTNSGGVPVDTNGDVVTLLVDGAYSMRVDDRQDNDKYYFANVLDGAPVTTDTLGDTPVIATGSTEPRTLSDRFSDHINALDYGVAWDGVTDDTVALQAAATAASAAGKRLHLPAFNTGLITGPISISGDTGVIGDGSSSSSITYKGTGNLFDWTGNPNIDETPSFTGFTVFVSTNAASDIITVTPSTILGRANRGVFIDDISITAINGGSFSSAINLVNVRNGVFGNSNINSDNTGYGLKLTDQCLDINISSSTFTSLETGILSDGNSEGILVEGCTLVGVTNGIINTPSGTGEPWISVANTHINFREYGIYLGQVLKSSIHGCLLFATSSTALTANTSVYIEGSNAQEIAISNNIFSGSIAVDPSIGVDVVQARKVSVLNNIFRDVEINTRFGASTDSCTAALNINNGAVTSVVDDSGVSNTVFETSSSGFESKSISNATLGVEGDLSAALRITDAGSPSDTVTWELNHNDGVLKCQSRDVSEVIQDILIRAAGNIISFGGELGSEALRVTGSVSNDNYVNVLGAPTGAGPSINAEGADANIDLTIDAKGSGKIRLNTALIPIGSESVTGYIEVKDSVGATIKLAVLS